ncbi:aminotransferase class IV [Orrella sp. JC864]|uniref:aminotransferase class IV n=1 Tax=Orrella sp. JC864 TaxID=3120298 RepID=UPI003008EA86
MEVPRADALTPPAGARLIETMRVQADGALPLLDGHLARLARSARALGYAPPQADLRDRLLGHAARLPRGQAHRLRLLCDERGACTLETGPLPALPAGPKLALAPLPLSSQEPLLRHKTTHRPWYQAAAAWLAAHPDHFDVLFLNERGELCEGSRSNVHLLRDGAWLTPPVSSGLLPGVQREALLAAGLVREAVLTRADLARARGLRLSNGLRGWFDVTPGLTLPAWEGA